MLSIVLEKLSHDNYTINNIDITYVGQVLLTSISRKIIKNLSKAIEIDPHRISCKATTTDKLGFEGNLEGISCHCVVLIDKG